MSSLMFELQGEERRPLVAAEPKHEVTIGRLNPIL